MTLKTLLLSAVAAISLPVAASAITIGPGSFGSLAAVLSPGGTITYDFEVSEPLTVYLTFAGTGLADDLEDVSYGFAKGDNTWDAFELNGPLFAAVGTLTFNTSTDFSVGFFDGIDNDVGTTFSYYAVSAVPVPAAGLLLGAAVAAAGGAAAIRRKKQNA